MTTHPVAGEAAGMMTTEGYVHGVKEAEAGADADGRTSRRVR